MITMIIRVSYLLVLLSLGPILSGCTSESTTQGSLFNSTSASSNGGVTSNPNQEPSPTQGSGGSFTPITNISAGAVVVHPTDSVASITSAVQSCSTHFVHFAAGTYTITSTINVPSNCQIEGELGWTSIITGGNGPDSMIFQFNMSSNVTVTRLNFQNIQGMVMGNQYGNGVHNQMIESPHIYLNLFDHTGTAANGQYGGAPAVWLWDPHNAIIERNACNAILGDCFHVFGTSTGAWIESFPQSSVTIRWNFDSHQNAGFNTKDFDALGFSMMEVQGAVGGVMIYQNVFYSLDNFTGSAMSIASGGVPCTGGTNGAFTGCAAPQLNGGKSGIVIDGNIILSNGLTGAPGNNAGIETMGPTPLVQNNFARGLGDLAFGAYIFQYNPATNNYTQTTSGEQLYFQNNVGCNLGDNGLLSTDASNITLQNISSLPNNSYSATCANTAVPALPNRIVVAPELLDGSGGLNSLAADNVIPGPNTYWPNVNKNLNFN